MFQDEVLCQYSFEEVAPLGFNHGGSNSHRRNGDDIASTNQAKFLLENNPWEHQDDVESHPSYAIGNVRMWFLPKRILWEDHLTNAGAMQQERMLLR